jgi:hypothetical protein
MSRLATAVVLPSPLATCQRGTNTQAASKGSASPTVSRKAKAAKKCGPPKGRCCSPTAIASSRVRSMKPWHSENRPGPEAVNERTDSAPAMAHPSEGRSA